MSQAYAKEMVRPEVVEPGFERSKMFAILRRFWAELTVVVLAMMLWAPRLSGPIDLRWDGGVYYLLGTSLAQGHGYRITSEPGTPEALQYPPLLPAFVALHEKLLNSYDPARVGPWLRKSYAALFVLYGLAAFAVAKVYLQPKWALAAAAMALLHHHVVFLSDLLYAELPFALIVLLFVLVTTRQRTSPRPRARELLLFILAAAAFLLRTAGLALFAAWIVDAIILRHWRLVLVRTALAVIPVVGWQSYVARVQASNEYAHPAYAYQRAAYQFSNVSYRENMSLRDPFRPEAGYANAGVLLRRVARNAATLPIALGEAVSAKADAWPLKRFEHNRPRQPSLISVEKRGKFADVTPDPGRGGIILAPIFVLSALMAGGMVLLVTRHAWITLGIMVGLVALICLTPWPLQLTRYLTPLAPFFAICFFLGWTKAYSWPAFIRNKQLAIIARVVLVCVLIATFAVEVYADGKLFYGRAKSSALCKAIGAGEGNAFFAHEESWQAWEKATNWIDKHAEHHAIIATSQPHLSYLLTGRRAVLPPMEMDPARERELLRSVPVHYVIIDQLLALDVTRHYVLPAIGNSEGWRLVYENSGAAIYAANAQR